MRLHQHAEKNHYVRAMVAAVKAGELSAVELGRMERTTVLTYMEMARAAAAVYVSSTLVYDDLRSPTSWQLVVDHTDTRAECAQPP